MGLLVASTTHKELIDSGIHEFPIAFSRLVALELLYSRNS